MRFQNIGILFDIVSSHELVYNWHKWRNYIRDPWIDKGKEKYTDKDRWNNKRS